MPMRKTVTVSLTNSNLKRLENSYFPGTRMTGHNRGGNQATVRALPATLQNEVKPEGWESMTLRAKLKKNRQGQKQ